MSDLKRYIKTRKNKEPAFAKDFDKGYESFKSGVVARREGTVAFPVPVRQH